MKILPLKYYPKIGDTVKVYNFPDGYGKLAFAREMAIYNGREGIIKNIDKFGSDMEMCKIFDYWWPVEYIKPIKL